MTKHNMTTCGHLLALSLAFTGCVDGQDEGDVADQQAEADADEADDEDTEDRFFCLYNSTPPATDHSDSLIGADDEVESEDVANGGCDLHMFKVTAAPPADRARTVHFHATSNVDFDEWSARVWHKSCAGLLCATNFSASSVPLTETGGGQFCPQIHECYTLPYQLHGELTFSATNSIADIRAGMRAIDVNGDDVEVTITVSE